jgi:hypothetical protein
MVYVPIGMIIQRLRPVLTVLGIGTVIYTVGTLFAWARNISPGEKALKIVIELVAGIWGIAIGLGLAIYGIIT